MSQHCVPQCGIGQSCNHGHLHCGHNRPRARSLCGAFSRCEEIQRDLNVSTSQLATKTLWGHAPFPVRFELWRETGRARTVVAREEVKSDMQRIGIKKCARESGFDRNFIRKVLGGLPV